MSEIIINKWSIMQNLRKDFVSNINSVYVYGTNGKQVIIITNDDNVYSFGDNDSYGCLGLGHTNAMQEPTKIVELCAKQVKQIEFGYNYNFVIARTISGKIYSWGCNINGELGIGYTTSQSKPIIINVLSDKNVIDINSGSQHSLALTKCGDAYIWGDKVGNRPIKMSFESLNQKIIAISSGLLHALALTNTGNVLYWGDNSHGQCGNGSNNNSYATKWSASQKITDIYVNKIACGPNHCMILSAKGVVYCFGNNYWQQCGDGTNVNKNIPTRVDINATFIDIAATKHYSISVGLTDKGFCYIWGRYGEHRLHSPIAIACNNMYEIIEFYSSVKVTAKPIHFKKQSAILMGKIAVKFDKHEYSDIVFKVENHYIYAQKTHLINVSSYFEMMFSDNKWLESNKSEIVIKDYSYVVYYAFIKYLYTDCVDICGDKTIELMDLANCYLDETLKQRCVQLIKNSINNENVFANYCSAIKCDSIELKAYCLEFVNAVKSNLEEIMDIAVKFKEN